jgi:hypothetical protein
MPDRDAIAKAMLPDLEVRFRRAMTAMDGAKAEYIRAAELFHRAWRPLVEAGSVTLADWSASYERATGQRPHRGAMRESGWWSGPGDGLPPIGVRVRTSDGTVGRVAEVSMRRLSIRLEGEERWHAYDASVRPA